MPLTLTLYGVTPQDLMADVYFRADFVALHALPDSIDSLVLPDFRHAAAVRRIPGAEEAEDMETPWGYGGPVALSEPAFWQGIGLWRQRQRDLGRIAEFVRLHPFLNPLGYRSWLDQIRFDRLTALVDLERPADARHGDYTKGTRYSLHQAERKLSIRPLGPNDADILQQCYEAGLARNKADRSYYFMPGYFSALLTAPYARAWVAERDGRAVAAACFLFSGTFAHYHLSGGGEEARSSFAHYLLLETALEHFAAQGCRFMHLGGGRSAAPEDELLRFKTRFSNWLVPFYTGGLVYDRAAYDRLTHGRGDRFLSYRFEPRPDVTRGRVQVDPATLGDVAAFFRIKCDVDNVVWSGHARPPEWSGLAAWYARHLKGGSGRRILIARTEGRAIGYLYLDDKVTRLEVTVGVGAGERGHGLGRAALIELTKRVASESDHRPMEAWVFPENVASVRAFEAAGFVRDSSRAPRYAPMPLVESEPRPQYCWVRAAGASAANEHERRAG